MHRFLLVLAAAAAFPALGRAQLAPGPTLPATGLTGNGSSLSVVYGTTAGTAAAGNDSRITGALQATTAASTYLPINNPTATGTLTAPSAVIGGPLGVAGAATFSGGLSGDVSAATSLSTGTTTPRTLAARGADVVNVKDFGATGNGTTNDCPSINAAISAANAGGGGTVFFPAGTYRSDDSVCRIVPLSHVSLLGAGRGRSTILIDDSKGGGDGLGNCAGYTCTPIVDFHLRDLTVSGMRASIVSAGAQIVRIGNATDLSVENCEFTQARQIGLVILSSNHVIISRNRVYHTNADGISAWDDADLQIVNNDIEGANDDAISAHSDNSAANPVRSGVLISGNTITESQGIHVMGAKEVTISDNILRRMMTYGIDVDAVYPSSVVQGASTPFGVKITNNTISDVFLRSEPNPRNQANDYIIVRGGPRVAAANGTIPGVPTVGSGTVPSLVGGDGVGNFYQNNVSSDLTNPGSGAYWFDISNNTLIRTLPAVAAYSDWGYNASLFVGNNGDATGTYNGPISDMALRPTEGIRIIGSLRNSRISGNTIQTGGTYGINFDQSFAWTSGDLDGLTIEGNTIADFKASGLWINIAGTKQRIIVRDNNINGDPGFVSVNRGPNGTWLSNIGASDIPSAAYLNGSGVAFLGNTFRNLSDIFPAASGASVVRGNLIYSQPTVTGWSTTNKGVGRAPNDGPEYSYVIEDSDPTSATYGQILSSQVTSATAMPTSGTYVAGHWVANSAPVAGIGDTVLGWLRLTTGSSNVLGTDWQEVHSWLSRTASGAETANIAAGSGTNATINLWDGGSLRWYLLNEAGAGDKLVLYDQAGGRAMLTAAPGGTVTIGSPGTAVVSSGALVDGSGVRTTLTTTGYTVPAGTSLVRFTQSSTVASSTITLPTAIADGQPIQFVNYGGAVTALTFSPAVNGWTNGATLAAYTGLRLRWDGTAAAWYREQ